MIVQYAELERMNCSYIQNQIYKSKNDQYSYVQ